MYIYEQVSHLILYYVIEEATKTKEKCSECYSGRNKGQKLVGHFLKIRHFCKLSSHICTVNLAVDFGRPNVEIGQKMANGRLLFLALVLLATDKRPDSIIVWVCPFNFVQQS